MERPHRPALTLFSAQPFAAGAELRLDEDAAQHARARRALVGDAVRLVDGAGRVARAALTSVEKGRVAARVSEVAEVPPPDPLEVVIPVADRDRMLLAAEKCVELQITAWRPAYFARSRSVSPRGEGDRFRDKVVARMRSALEQSGGAWLPSVHAERDYLEVLEEVATPSRIILDAGGAPMLAATLSPPVAIAVGPEGGLEPRELEGARRLGWVPASLGSTTLRFETAIIAGVAIARATQHAARRP